MHAALDISILFSMKIVIYLLIIKLLKKCTMLLVDAIMHIVNKKRNVKCKKHSLLKTVRIY